MTNPGLAPPSPASGHSIPHRLVTTTLSDGLAVLTVCRPQVQNALNPAAMFQLHRAIASAREDPRVRGIVIRGSGRHFVIGADIGFFLSAMQRRDVQRILDFIVAGNACFDAIERCDKPVVAALNGPAFGGGWELALACKHRIGRATTSLAFPETGLGLVPGWGGAVRAARLIGTGLAKWLVYTGKIVGAADALRLGLIDYVADDTEFETLVRNVALGKVPTGQSCPPRSEADAVLDRFFTTYSVEEIRSGSARHGGNPALVRTMRQVAGKGPLALRYAERHFAEVDRLSAPERLHSSLQMMWEIFHSRDAHLGLASRQQGHVGPVAFQGT